MLRHTSIPLRVIFAALLSAVALPTSHAADPNGYTSIYECRSGNGHCDVDIATYVAHACDQTITTSDSAASIDSKINGGSQYICIQPGDYTGIGIVTITASGTASARKVLRYTRSGDTDDDPWNQSAANKATLLGLAFNGGDYWIVHRLTLARGNNDGVALRFLENADSDNNIVNRIEAIGGNAVVEINASDDHNTVQNSVLHDAFRTPNEDNDCVDVGNGSDNHIVNNEIFNCPSHSVYTWGNAPAERTVIENNDVYTSTAWYTDCNGNYTPSNPSAPCAVSEAALSLKATTAGTNIYQVIHNRFWGTRQTDTSICCIDGSFGQLISISDNGAGQSVANYVLFQNNIVFDGPIGIQHPHSDVTNHNNSYIGNIVWKIHDYAGSLAGYTVDLENGDLEDFYLNTFVDADRWGDFGTPDSDWRCNVWAYTGTIARQAASGTQVDRNAFYGVTPYSTGSSNVSKTPTTRANSTAYAVGDILRTGAMGSCASATDTACFLYKVIQSGTSAASAPAYCNTLSCTTTDGSVTVKAVRGPYAFKRKLRTVASGESVVIPYARVDSAADEANSCPSAGQTDATGSRTGIGVNDDVAWSGVFTTDLAGTSRAGSVGALQTGSGTGGSGTSTPFFGTPLSVPGTIQAEDFDNGGEGVAYHDLDPENRGNAFGNDFRTTESVDIEPIPDNAANPTQYDVGWGQAGEWLNYTVNVAAAGTYTLTAFMGQVESGATFHVEFDGVNVTGTLVVPNTGDWQVFAPVSATVNLPAGTHVMTLRIDSNTASGFAATIDYFTITAANQTAGLLAQWKLDDGAGTTAADASGAGHTGTLVNGPVWDAAGRFGGALDFDGVDDFVSIASPPVVGDQSAFTVSAWVKITSTQDGVLYSEENTSSQNPFVYLSINENTTGDAEFGVRDNTGTWGGISAPALGLNNGQWHLLVGVQRSKTDREFFIDGTSVGQSAVAIGTVTVNQADMGKFDVATSGNHLQGALDDVRIYNRPLTTTEIQALFNGS